jgi:hypothetical protein
MLMLCLFQEKEFSISPTKFKDNVLSKAPNYQWNYTNVLEVKNQKADALLKRVA